MALSVNFVVDGVNDKQYPGCARLGELAGFLLQVDEHLDKWGQRRQDCRDMAAGRMLGLILRLK